MNHQALRLSRLRAPRATPRAALLLAIVFIAFGLLFSTLGMADSDSAPRYLDASVATLTDYLLRSR